MLKSSDFPVFVVGSSRSGTTLLYSMLLASGEFAIYEAETMLLEVCKPKYGDLKREINYERFIEDWINSKQFHRSGLDVAKFKRNANEYRKSYTDFLKYFMESIAKKQGKKRWAEQTPGHLFQMDDLSDAFPNAKFIHIIRDGRDVALSKRKEGWTGTRSNDPIKQLVCAALTWEMCIKKGQAYGKKLGDNYVEIRYEDIINNLDNVLKKINTFTQISLDQYQINHCSIGSLGKGNTAFNDKMEGISNKGLRRWKSGITDIEIQSLHIVIGKTLIQLDYEVNNLDSTLGLFLTMKIKAYLILCRLLLNLKLFLKQKTFVGRFSSSGLEIGLQ